MSARVRWGSGALLALILGFPPAHAGLPPRVAYVVGSGDGSLARVDLDARTVTPAVATVGSSPNRIEVAADLSYAAIANSGSDDVTILDLATETVTGTIDLPPGSNPWTVEIAGNRVFTTALATDTVWELDRTALTVVAGAPTGKSPEGMCVAADRLWIANTGFDFGTFEYDPGTVSVLDVADLSLVTTVSVGVNPQECLLAPDGRVHVICTGDFGGTAGAVHVIDPLTSAPVDTLDVGGYPGGGATHRNGEVILNVLTFSFTSEIWVYDVATLAWVRDGSDSLFETSDFLGNPRVTARGDVLLPDFDADLLVIEDLGDPGHPDAVLVGDAPIDAGVVQREEPVSLVLSGVSAVDAENGVRLSWHSTAQADVVGFVVERRAPAVGDFERVASDLPVRRESTWLDRDARLDVPHTYRVGARRAAGMITWSTAITFARQSPSAGRLAIRRVTPNPFRRLASIELQLPGAGRATVEILDVRGRRVIELDAGVLPQGASHVVWDGRTAAGEGVAPGVYFARVRVGGDTAVTRLLRVR